MPIVYLYLALLYIRPQDWLSIVYAWPVNAVVVPIMVIIGFININKNTPEEGWKRFGVQGLLLAGYLVAVVLSNIKNSELDKIQEEFLTVLKSLIAFAGIVWNINSWDRMWRLLRFIALLTFILAIHAVIQGHTGIGIGGGTLTPGYDEVRVRWWGDWDGPNVFAILFIVAIPIGLELLTRKEAPLWVRFGGLSSTALFIYSIYLTNSRGGFLALFVVVSIYCALRFSIGKSAILAIACVLILVAIAPSRLSRVQSGESSAHERVYTWERGLVLFRANPIIGIGKGEFGKKSGTGLIAHSNYVQSFAETGLFGFFFFMGSIWYSVKGLFFIWKRSAQKDNRDPTSRCVSRVLLASFVGFLAVTFFVVKQNDLLYILIGLCTSSILIARRDLSDISNLEFGKKDFAFTMGAMIAVMALVWVAAIERIV